MWTCSINDLRKAASFIIAALKRSGSSEECQNIFYNFRSSWTDLGHIIIIITIIESQTRFVFILLHKHTFIRS